MKSVRFVGNGMTPAEICALDRQFGRSMEEFSEYVDLKVDRGADQNGVGGYVLKIKSERYGPPQPPQPLDLFVLDAA